MMKARATSPAATTRPSTALSLAASRVSSTASMISIALASMSSRVIGIAGSDPPRHQHGADGCGQRGETPGQDLPPLPFREQHPIGEICAQDQEERPDRHEDRSADAETGLFAETLGGLHRLLAEVLLRHLEELGGELRDLLGVRHRVESNNPWTQRQWQLGFRLGGRPRCHALTGPSL